MTCPTSLPILHDLVIQRVHDAALLLHGARALVRTDPETAIARIDAAIAGLDGTISEVRAAIFRRDVGNG